MLNKHEVDKHISCPHCDFRAPRISNIHIHIDGHHAELYEKQFDCHHCSRWSTCVSSLPQLAPRLRDLFQAENRIKVI